MTQEMVIGEIVKDMSQKAEEYCDTAEHVIEVMAVGDTWWQGDLGIQYVGKTEDGIDKFLFTNEHHRSIVKINSVKLPWQYLSPNAAPVQLAEGNDIGSKHVLTFVDEPEKIQCAVQYMKVEHLGPLIGYVIKAEGPFAVRHPVHGDVECKEPGIYLIRFQRQWVKDREQDVLRARD